MSHHPSKKLRSPIRVPQGLSNPVQRDQRSKSLKKVEVTHLGTPGFLGEPAQRVLALYGRGPENQASKRKSGPRWFGLGYPVQSVLALEGPKWLSRLSELCVWGEDGDKDVGRRQRRRRRRRRRRQGGRQRRRKRRRQQPRRQRTLVWLALCHTSVASMKTSTCGGE